MWTLKSGPGQIWGGGRPTGPTPLATGLNTSKWLINNEIISPQHFTSFSWVYFSRSFPAISIPKLFSKHLKSLQIWLICELSQVLRITWMRWVLLVWLCVWRRWTTNVTWRQQLASDEAKGQQRTTHDGRHQLVNVITKGIVAVASSNHHQHQQHVSNVWQTAFTAHSYVSNN